MAKLKYLVIHCTATPRGRRVSAEDIRRWHIVERGWNEVGYTDLFHLDGTVERLVQNNEDAEVDPWEITNGARGYNSISRHIVYVGGLSRDGSRAEDTRTVWQKEALRKYVLAFHRRHPDVRIIGHNDISAKACPSFDVSAWLRTIGINQK